MNHTSILTMRFAAFVAAALIIIGLIAAAFSASGLARAQTVEAPEISNIVATTSDTTAHVTWDTDEPATSQVRYGTTTDNWQYSAHGASLVTDHSILLTNLEEDTLYYYQVISGFATTSTDYGTTTSDERTFKTDKDDRGHDWEWGNLGWLKEKINELLERMGLLEDRVEDLEHEIDNGNGDGNGNGGSEDGDAYIEQDGITVTPGQHVDFAGKNFGSEELVIIERDGSNIGRTAFTNLAGSFTTGSIVMPTEEGTYTFTFTGQESDEVAEAEITVEE